MYWRIVVFIGLIAGLATEGFAPFETRNGGYGVVENGLLYSYDLHLRHVHVAPYIGGTESLSEDEATDLQENLYRLNLASSVYSIVDHKLAAIRLRSVQLGREDLTTRALEKMREFTWLKLNVSCIDVHDETDPVPTKVQVAYREGSMIRFCKDFFVRLAPEQQAAVLVHELIYTMSDNLDAVVKFVGLVFDPDFGQFDSSIQVEFAAAETALEQASTRPTGTAFSRSTPDEFGRFYLRISEENAGAGTLISSVDPFLVGTAPNNYLRGMLPQYVAPSACKFLNLAGITEWRLATLSELRTLGQLGISEVSGFEIYSWYSQPDGDTFGAASLESGDVLTYPRLEEESTVCIREPSGA